MNDTGTPQTWEWMGGTFTDGESWLRADAAETARNRTEGDKTRNLVYSAMNAVRCIRNSGNDDELTICDASGNVICRIGKNGVAASNINEIEKKTASIDEKYEDELIICDKQGNVVCRIGKNGIESPNIQVIEEKLNDETSQTWLTNKNIFVYGDSLSMGGNWMKVLAELTGANFDQTINKGTNELNEGKPISWGGTQTYGYNDDNNDGTQRAKNLVELSKKVRVDVLFIQNVNDANSLGSCFTEGEYTYEVQHERLFSEAPQFPEECVANEQVFLTAEEAVNDFKDNIIARIGDTPRSHGMMYRFKYGANAVKLKITGTATADGTFDIIVNGSTYGCSVTTGMSVSEICDKIVEYDYPNYTDTKNSDGSVSFIDLQSNTPDVSYDANGTGITAEITTEQKSSKGFRVYKGYDYTDEEFGNFANWGQWYELGTMYSKYKGLIEYLQKNLPDTKIFFIISPFISTNFAEPQPDVTFADGTFDMTKLIKKTNRALAEIQRDVAEFYRIPVIDVDKEWGINYFNAYPKYYNNKDVHPKDEGYRVWGETVARLLCGK